MRFKLRIDFTKTSIPFIMALMNPKISPLSCFASTNPNNLPKFLVSEFHSTVASFSPSNTTKRSSPSKVYHPVSNYSTRFDHKISIVCTVPLCSVYFFYCFVKTWLLIVEIFTRTAY